MTNLINEFALTATLPFEIILALLLSPLLLVGRIGFERESRDRPARLRTHMLVGLAAALYCLLTQEILNTSDEYSDRAAMDPLRLIEAVTSGAAFWPQV